MTLSTIDPTVALVVIDLQHAITRLPAVHDVDQVIAKAAQLADAFRERGLPVVLVQAAGRAPGRTEAGLAMAAQAAKAAAEGAPAAPSPLANPELMALVPEIDGEGIRITKRTWGAFQNTDLHEQLQARGVTQVVVVGIATSKGVESTARAAWEHGYHVTIATDAMTDSSLAAHDNSVGLVFPSIGETGTVAEVIALLPATAAGAQAAAGA
ncbi:Nicotinamidase-related amidase [Agromyces sp. CF514]|uniref:isochorismatase family protein n=1 Tax=Agromyces sp. CF514 TaxID=1881031 RepID=UPI0008E4200B|nr:isochorismatase family protein [Agromyces sp. CF514]SFR91637.1 Nicotinamidase-related amidase [Agromyces sp. CF514]